MPNRHVTRERSEILPTKNIPYQASTPKCANESAVRGCNARTLLAPVLERMQTQIGQVGGLRVSENTEYTALITEGVWSKMSIVGHGVDTGSEGAVTYPVESKCASVNPCFGVSQGAHMRDTLVAWGVR